ncbi:MAG TPA: class I SAM-dependent RNA methyltransferase [Gemmatimonadales bacterium]
MSAAHECFAIVAPGLEALAVSELVNLGARVVGRETGGVSFSATSSQLYAANLHLRTVSRVIVRVARFRATAFWELEKQAKLVPWDAFVPPGGSVTLSVTSRKSKLYHQRGIAERLTEAVRQQVSGASGSDSDAAQLFLVRVDHDQVGISADSSGALLHQRGYRLDSGKAPLRETLAAAMLLGAGWDGTAPLLDPFSGSGTIPIEAAMLARRIPPGWRREFAFERWPGFDGDGWRRVKADAEERILPTAPAVIIGSDRDAGSIEAAQSNAARADVQGSVQFERRALSEVTPPAERGWLITNPPYGVRVGEADRLRDLYARLGQVLSRMPGWSAGILAADARLIGQTRLQLAEVWRGKNGGIPVRFMVSRRGVSG